MFRLAIPIPILFILLVVGCGKVPTAEPDKPVLHFAGVFESGNINGFHYLVPDTTFNTRVVTAPVRRGLFALKNTTRPEDLCFRSLRSNTTFLI